MTEILDAARTLRDRLGATAPLAKDRPEYLRTVACYNDAVRLVEALEVAESAPSAPSRPEPLTVLTEGPACSSGSAGSNGCCTG